MSTRLSLFSGHSISPRINGRKFGKELKPHPQMLALPHLSKKSGAEGLFAWPPVNDGKNVTSHTWHKQLQSWYARAKTGKLVIPVAFPGFKDIYESAKVGKSYGYIDHRNGKTFSESLNLALAEKTSFIQIATWNDFGEGNRYRTNPQPLLSLSGVASETQPQACPFHEG